jgi:FMN reductase
MVSLEVAQRVVAISGSPRAPSKSKTLAEAMLAVFNEHRCSTQMIDVAGLPANALLARVPSPELDSAIAAVGEARIVIAATPTYRALYTGALKCFFDLMPPGHLAGKVCVPIQTGLAPQHFLAVEYGFRPLFASLDGIPIAGVYATDDQFEDNQPSDKLRTRIKNVALTAMAFGRVTGG